MKVNYKNFTQRMLDNKNFKIKTYDDFTKDELDKNENFVLDMITYVCLVYEIDTEEKMLEYFSNKKVISVASAVESYADYNDFTMYQLAELIKGKSDYELYVKCFSKDPIFNKIKPFIPNFYIFEEKEY